MESWTVVPRYHDLLSYSDSLSHKSFVSMSTWSQDTILLASRVFSFGDGLLGSPVPRVLEAITLNSYSAQGNKSTTVAVSAFPSISAGARRKCADFIFRATAHYVKKLYSAPYPVLHLNENVLNTTMKSLFWSPFLCLSLWDMAKLHFRHFNRH